MTAYLHAFFAAAPLAAIALALGLGCLCGKPRIRTFGLGSVAATLLVAIALGQVGVNVSDEVKISSTVGRTLAPLPPSRNQV